MKKLILPFTLLLTMLLMLSCSPTTPPTAAPATVIATEEMVATATTAPPTAMPEPTATLAPLPPTVLQAEPELGAEQPLDAPIQIKFDQAMQRESVEKAFAIEPGASVDGTFEWLDDQTLRFSLKDGWQRNQRYKVRVVESAQSETGLSMNRPFELRFSTAGFLEVTTVQPADKAEEIAADTGVVVVFNRPVVALSEIGTAGTLPDPLTFTPPMKGKGNWLNTAIYQFTPDAPGFLPATSYKARVAKGLQDSVGQAMLADDFEWQFMTVSPAVVGNLPPEGQLYVSATSAITVAFNQPMAKDSVEKAFMLQNSDTEQMVKGSFKWLDEPMELLRDNQSGYYDYEYDEGAGPETVGVQMMIFTPDEPLTLGAEYEVKLPKGVLGATSETAKTSSDFQSKFTVIPLPEITFTDPDDGDEAVETWQNFQVGFNAPMQPESLVLGKNLLFSPEISATQVYSYWDSNNTQFSLSFPSEASTKYQVRVLPDGITSRDGDVLTEGVTINWETRAANAAAYFQTPNFVALYNAYTDTLIYASVRNVSQVDLGLYQLGQADFIKLNEDWSYRDNFQPSRVNKIVTWSMFTTPTLNSTFVYRINLGEKARRERLAPGLYYLEANIPTKAIYPEAVGEDYYPETTQRQILVVSKYNVTLKNSTSEAMAWLTDLQSGQSVKDVPVSFIATPYDEPEVDLGDGKTAVDGVATVQHDETLDAYDAHYAFAGDVRTNEDFAVTSSEWEDGISRWNFNNITVQDYSSKYSAHIYSDRRIYRPQQTVYFKGILRADDDAHYSVPTEVVTAAVQVLDGQGKELWSDDVNISDMGTFHGEFALDTGASLGFYSIQVSYQDYTFSTDFQVAEYRKPEYLVEVKTDKAEYVQGDKVKIAANAQFYSGGPVSNANVKWTLLTDDFYFRYQGKGFYDFTDYDYSRFNATNYTSGGGYQIAEGDGVTDKEGNVTFEVEADIADRVASQTFTFDVNIEDLNNQTVASQARATIHKGLIYVGLRPERYIGKVNGANQVNVITVDWDSEPVADQAVQVVFAQHNWYSAQKQYEDGSFYWDNWVEDVPVFTTTVNTDAQGMAQAEFTPKDGGIYKVIATSPVPDLQGFENLAGLGNGVRSSTYMWVSGSDYVNWRQENNDRLDLVTDQREYKVGDVAKILIPHPYNRPVQALLTLERAHIYSHTVITLATNSEQIEIPITEEMIPNMYLSVVIIDGASPVAYMDEKTNQPVGLPSMKLGYASMPINNAEKELNITLTPNKTESYQPQEQASYKVEVTNSDGKPVEAELSLALVDKAVLALAPEIPGQLMQNFWQARGLGVKTAGGLTLAIDRVNLAASPQAKGGGGGIEANFGDIRGDFRETAFWLPDLKTDKNGHGTMEATLPDNLTTWTLTGKGVTADTKVGEATVDIVSTKPVLVRPMLPRFLVVGDEARLGMIVQNSTQEDLSLETAFVATGAEVKPLADSAVVKVAAGERVKVEYIVTVPTLPSDGKINFTMGVQGGEYKDAMTLEIPAYQESTPETVATAGVLAETGQRTESIVLPSTPPSPPESGGDSGGGIQGDLTVKVDHSLAAGMRAGLDYLEHFRYECTEQTVSRFLPNVMTYRAYQKLQFTPPMPPPDSGGGLPELVSLGLQRLYGQQHADGGWGWWVRDVSNPNLTAYVLLSLVEAERAEFSVDETVMANATEYLRNSLIAPSSSTESWKLNRQAFVLYVLAEAEAGDVARNKTLFKQRDRLDLFGQAYLAMAYHLTSPKNKDIDTLLNNLTDKAIVSATGAHWEEQQVDYYAMNTDTRSTAIVIAALSRIQPDHPLLPNAVRWLMTIRKNGGHWETTQETAWALIGLTDWMVVTGELEGDYAWQVSLNGKDMGQGQVDKKNVGETTELKLEIKDLVEDTANRLVFERDEGDKGRLYYAAYLTYYKAVEEVKALDRGVIVSRQYLSANKAKDEREGSEGSAKEAKVVTEAKVGDTITVKLTIIAPNDLHYVMVEDPIPAGTEAIDTSLATTSIANDDPDLDRIDRQSPWGPDYGRWYFSHTELRDDRAVLFATYLPKGTYEYTYQVRASIAGEFRVRPTHAEEMYFPEVFGRGDGGVFTVTE